ncbi:MAG: bifunctional alpha/beta hydrolase/OsmC family protein [Pseudomonadota bacterium]
MGMRKSVTFQGANGQTLSGRLDIPDGGARAFALFAHCFSCSKDIAAARQIAVAMNENGIGLLRFDFTGLGASEGSFSDTNFSTNLDDLEAAAAWLENTYGAPQLLIGHSLGGAAVVAVANRLPAVKAVATIGAPSDADHVIHQFGSRLEEIATTGEAEVDLAGRPFTIKKQFVDDVSGAKVREAAAGLGRPLLVLHAPLDDVVGLENATGLFTSAKHPKSFVSLDGADHLLSNGEDARFAANIISSWFGRYIDEKGSPGATETVDDGVLVEETGAGKFQAKVVTGRHSLLADEPTSVGGDDSGPSPYDLVSAGLGACTTMTLRMYAERKDWPVGKISVHVSHAKDYADDCANCEEGSRIDIFERRISVGGDLTAEQHNRMIEIADKCPVHRTLESVAHIRTERG